MRTLREIGEDTGTDKIAYHRFDPFYELHFGPLRHEAVTLLEIGVLKGASLRMWEEYFPHARIFGIDADPACRDLSSAKSRVLIGRQERGGFLRKVVRETGPLDIVIDDGGHRMEEQQASFWFLFPHLRPGGIYVIEDLFTSFMDEFGGNRAGSTIDTLKGLLEATLYSDHARETRRWLHDIYGTKVGKARETFRSPAPIREMHVYDRGIAFLVKGGKT